MKPWVALALLVTLAGLGQGCNYKGPTTNNYNTNDNSHPLPTPTVTPTPTPTPGFPPGAPCSDNLQCVSRSCAAGVCQ